LLRDWRDKLVLEFCALIWERTVTVRPIYVTKKPPFDVFVLFHSTL
jgi:hypothetical protein